MAAAEPPQQPAQPLSDARRAAIIESAFFGPNKGYVRWDTGLHEIFEEAVEALGGAHAAKPANIRERMGIGLLTTAQVKSHLQKHRIRVVAEQGSQDATEAQARAAARLLERQKRAAESGAPPARPRLLVPIRGSRQASAGLGAGEEAGLGGGAPRPKRRARKRRAYSDGTSSEEGGEEFAEEEEEGEEAGEDPGSDEWEGGEEEEEGWPTRRRPRASGKRRRRADSGRADTDGEAGSAGTAGGSGVGASRGGAAALRGLSRLAAAQGPPPDESAAAAAAGPAQRRADLLAAATAAALAGSGGGRGAGLPAAPALAEGGGVAAAARQPGAGRGGSAQAEAALLEQSMWVQQLAAEVQELRSRQRQGLPPPPPDAAAFSSPFAMLAQAEFPPGGEPSPSQPAAAQWGAPGKPAAALATCDSALLRLLSASLGQGAVPQLAAGGGKADATMALLQSLEGVGAGPRAQAPLGLPAQGPAGGGADGKLLAADSGLLRMLSQTLREAALAQPDEPAPGGGDAATQAALALTAAAARLSATAGQCPTGPSLAAAVAAAAAASPFSGAAAPPLAPPPSLPPSGLGMRLSGQQVGSVSRQPGSSLDVGTLLAWAGMSGSATVSGPTSRPPAASGPEFLRLCSLPGAADLLPSGE